MHIVRLILAPLFLAGLLVQPAAAATEADGFLPSLAGAWSGGGTVTTRIGAAPTRVRCRFDAMSSPTTLSMSGTCRGLLVIRRAISADLKRSGQRYTGAYVGPSGQPSRLSGTRQGQALQLGVRWNRVINGDRDATMVIRKSAERLMLRTLDRDPATGINVVTSEITLSR